MNTQDIFNIALASKLTGGSGAKTLGELTDVNVDSVTNNQIIKYDSSSSTWVNSDVPSELPVPTLSDIGKIPTVDSLGAWELAKPSSDVAIFYGSITTYGNGERITLSNSKTVGDIYDAIEANKFVIIDATGQIATTYRKIFIYQENYFPSGNNYFKFLNISPSTSIVSSHLSLGLIQVDIRTSSHKASNILNVVNYQLPYVESLSASNNGQVLQVVDGTWSLVNLWKDITGTLTTGQTSIVLSDASITTSSTIQVFTDTGINYTAISVATGSVTITYPSQQSDVNVKVRVS